MRALTTCLFLSVFLVSCKQTPKSTITEVIRDTIKEEPGIASDSIAVDSIDTILPTRVVSSAPILKEIAQPTRLEFTQPKAPEKFYYNTEKDSTFIGKEGTKISISANSFVDSKGQLVTGKVKIELTEYYSTLDIVRTNLSTSSNGKQLETGGMLHIKALQHGAECQLAKGKSIKTEFASEGSKQEGMQMFYGEKDSANGIINWVTEIKNEVDIKDTIEIPSFITVETVPQFPGGMEAWTNFLRKNIVYPTSAKDSCIQGKVHVAITIDKDGKVIQKDIVKGIRPDFNQEVLKGLENLPNFKINENPKLVYPRFYLPVNFKISECSEPIILSGKARNLPPLTGLENESTYKSKILLFKSSQLGWINCDKFTRTNQTLFTQKVKLNDSEKTTCFLIFHNIKSIMPAYPSAGGFKFLNVPINTKASLVAIEIDGDNLKYKVKTFNTKKDLSQTIVLEPGSETELKKLLAQFDT